MAEDKDDIYRIEPLDEEEGAAPIPPPQVPGAAEPPRARLDEPGLLDDFEEDADFTRDPELERAVSGAPVAAPPPAARLVGRKARPRLVRPGWDDPRIMAGVGGTLTLLAIIAAWITAGARHPQPTPVMLSVVTALLALYKILLHTGTGVAAVAITAFFHRRRIGHLDVAAARMFVAVSLFMLIFSVEILTRTKAEELFLATGAYLGVIAATFRLKRDPFLLVVGVHFMLWLLVEVGIQLGKLAEGFSVTPA